MRANRIILVALVSLVLPACTNFSKLDYSKLPARAAWQHPERVVESLEIRPGDSVADLGSGNGYFLPYLSAAVGAAGTVYAVEVDAELARKLEERVGGEGLTNVVVVLGDFDDPRLPDGEIDLVFLCNAYHHIEERSAYFRRLQADLSRGGRVAVLDPNEELDGVLGWFTDEGHTMRRTVLVEEMGSAGYESAATFDFLPIQVFELFAPRPPTSVGGNARQASDEPASNRSSSRPL